MDEQTDGEWSTSAGVIVKDWQGRIAVHTGANVQP